jgi:hypothetical protein
MARKRRTDRRVQPRRQHLRSIPSHPENAGGDSAQDQQLFQGLRHALRSGQPVELLEAVSSMLTVVDPRTRNPFESNAEPGITLTDVVDSFVGTDYAETTAALTVIRSMVEDELLGNRIGKVLTARRQPMPDWLGSLDALAVPRVVMLTHVLGDGDDYLLDARLPGGGTFTALVYVDHNLGTVVKDAFVIAEDLDVVLAKMDEALVDPDQKFVEAEPAQSRPILTEAINHGAIMYPPLESDTWPGCRPLVEWLVRSMPTGGEVPGRHEWTDEEQATICEDFFASSYGRKLDHDDERGLLDSIVWFGTGWGPGDPFRWSPVNVEMLLADWIPRKILAEPSFLAKAPNLLRAFIRYCHDRRDIRAQLTAETLAAVDQWEPVFQRAIRSSRLQGPEALLADVFEPGEEDETRIAEYMLERLDRTVGGRLMLRNLTEEPLPDEPFEWAGVPDDIHDRVRDVLELCDDCADELLDIEHRTAMRRLLSRAAVGDPQIFRRKGTPERAAAAVAWVVGRANESVGTYRGTLEVQELLGWFGVHGSISQRAEVFLKAIGVNPYDQFGQMDLGAPDLLVAERRAGIIESRDRYLEGS